MEEIIAILSQAIDVRMLNAAQTDAFERGLALLENYPPAKRFVADSRHFHDYQRRVRYIIRYLNNYVKSTNDTTNVVVKRRVGRPTKEEQAAYAEMQKKKIIKETKASLFPDIKPDLSLQALTYKGIVANPNGESIAATMPHLKQLMAFLSEPLQVRVNKVRDLRIEMATKAEQAKTMIETNDQLREQRGQDLYAEDEIGKLTARAVEIESHILPDIYQAVDREIGECYLRLSQRTGDPEYIAWVKKTFNVAPNDLRTLFKPFYEKAQKRDPLFSETIEKKIAEERPEVKAARDAAAKHKAEADAIVKYILRKDKPSTEARVRGLRERIAKLRKSYADIVTEEELKGFDAILEKTIAESKNKA